MAAGYPARTPAQRIWLAGATGLILILLLAGGWLVWRGLTTTTPPPAAVPGGPSEAALADQPAVFGAPQMIDGVPWGFALTVEGAAAAAAVALAVTGQPEVVFDEARFAEVAAVVFAPEQVDVQARQVASARTEFELSGWAGQPEMRRMYHFAPLAVSVTAFDPQRPAATVEVWAVTLVGVGDAGGAVFTTSTISLEADPQRETWQVTSIDTVEGPVPMVADTASAPGRLRALLREASPTLPLPLPRDRQP